MGELSRDDDVPINHAAAVGNGLKQVDNSQVNAAPRIPVHVHVSWRVLPSEQCNCYWMLQAYRQACPHTALEQSLAVLGLVPPPVS